MRLEGKTALVTGGGRGIGQAIALRFAAEGARVAIVGPHAETLADTVAKGTGIEPLIGDVTKKSDVDAAIASVMRNLGRIDVLVNNAGGTDPKPFEEKTAADWMRSYELNVVSAFLCAQAAAPHIRVNAVGPGHTKTDIWKKLPSGVKDKMLDGTYLKRFAEPEDIASAVLFFASDEAGFITGQHLVVDGGFALKSG